MILLLVLLSVLWVEQGLCLQDHGGFLFDGDIRQFAVATSGVYVATDTKLYQMNHNLTLFHSLTLRGILKDADEPHDEQFYRVSETAGWNATFSINLLLPFVENNTVFICGMTDNQCGYCEVLDLHDISKLLYREHIQVGPLRSSSGSVSFLVDVKKNPTQSETYILTAIQQRKDGPEWSRCFSDSQTINLQDADHDQDGGIFSYIDSSGKGTPVIRNTGDVEFIDGFQISSVIFLLANVLPEDSSSRVRLLWLDGRKTKTGTVKSLKGVILSVSDGGDGGGSRLLASSVIPGQQPVLWSGVFSVDGGEINTELLVFDISPDMSGPTDKDPDFYKDKRDVAVKPKTLRPTAVLFRRNSMTSVLAVRQKTWMVFFIGTADAQLIKLAVDRNFHPACPTLLYSMDNNQKVFPRILLDPVDHKHVYVPFKNQMKRVAVAKCSTYNNIDECWSAQDPHCVWCVSETRCTFEDDCNDSDWLSIPDDSQQKMVSHKVVKDFSGQIVLIVRTHLTVGRNQSNFTCHFSATSTELCRQNNTRPHFQQCICILSNSILPADGILLGLKIRLGTTLLSEQLKVTNCTDINGPPGSVLCQQCIKAGCGWSNGGCFWAHGVGDDSVCLRMEHRENFSRPEISSITPSVVSFYGRNHAMLSGRNLREVTGVRIQEDLSCTPQEYPVWNNTGVSLMFHITSTHNKGVVKVCVLLPDGSCHGNTTITYRSAPFCTNIEPNSSWTSGKREITLMGSDLEFVEAVVHSHALQEVRLPKDNSSYQKFTYDSPAADKWISSSTVLLKVANHTLTCSTKITYYPDPEFTKFTSVRTGDDIRITIEKKADKLELTEAELSVWGVHEEIMYPCIMTAKNASSDTDFFTCEIKSPPDTQVQRLMIKYGDTTVSLRSLSLLYKVITILRFLLIPCIIAALVLICRWQRRLTFDKNKL